MIFTFDENLIDTGLAMWNSFKCEEFAEIKRIKLKDLLSSGQGI